MSPREPSIIARQNTGIPFCTRWRGGGGGGGGWETSRRKCNKQAQDNNCVTRTTRTPYGIFDATLVFVRDNAALLVYIQYYFVFTLTSD